MILDLYTDEELEEVYDIIYRGIRVALNIKLSRIPDPRSYFASNPTFLKSEGIVFAMELPFEEIPLWVHDTGYTIGALLKYRLEHGR